VKCSKGTYIRTLAEDLAAKLGVGGHLSRLHRVQAGVFQAEDMIDLAWLEQERGENDFKILDKCLNDAEIAVKHLAKVEVSEREEYYVRLGQAIALTESTETGIVRIKQGQNLVGIGEVTSDGRLQPKRLLHPPVNAQLEQ
jgi:tRNA pseudouridine55 synthase